MHSVMYAHTFASACLFLTFDTVQKKVIFECNQCKFDSEAVLHFLLRECFALETVEGHLPSKPRECGQDSLITTAECHRDYKSKVVMAAWLDAAFTHLQWSVSTLLSFSLYFPHLPHSAWHDKVFDPAKTSSRLKQNNKLFPLGMGAKKGCFPFCLFPIISIFWRHKERKDWERNKLGGLWDKTMQTQAGLCWPNVARFKQKGYNCSTGKLKLHPLVAHCSSCFYSLLIERLSWYIWENVCL